MKKAKPRTSRVLGVDPGCRYLGTAVVEGSELIHHAVDDVAGGTSAETMRRAEQVIGRLVEAYQPELLVVERAFFSRGAQAPLLRKVTDAILAVGIRSGLRTISVAPSSLKKRTTGNGHATKAEVAAALCRRYPQLRLYVGSDRKWRARVHSNRFDAIALALLGPRTTGSSVPENRRGASPAEVRGP